MNKLDTNSILFDRYFGLEASPLSNAMSSVADGISGVEQATAKNILFNLWIAWSYEIQSGNPMYVAIQRDKNAYRFNCRYKILHLSYHKVRQALDMMVGSMMLEQHIGFWNEEKHRGKITRIRATPRLARAFAQIKATFSRFPCSSVIVRNEDGKLVPPPNAEIHRRMEKRLDRINRNLRFHKVGIPTELALHWLEKILPSVQENNLLRSLGIPGEVHNTKPSKRYKLLTMGLHEGTSDFCDLTKGCHLTRIFNNGRLDRGGRYYCDIQSFAEQDRVKLLIDGEPVVELDYSALHPRWLYAKEGIDYKGDPYTLAGLSRADAKLVSLICINAASRTRAEAAIRYSQNKEWTSEAIHSQESPDALLNRFETKHPDLEKYFYSGIGLEFMYRDSELAEAILLHFTKMREACICVHDSFIVRKSLEGELRRVMIKEYRARTGFDPVIK